MSVILSDIPLSVKIADFVNIQHGVTIGERTRICNFVNLYGCKIGSDCLIGTFVEAQEGCVIGNKVRIQSHCFLCTGTTIGNNVFLGHGVLTINDTFGNGKVNYEKEMWGKLVIENDCIIGSGAVLFPVTIGHHAVIGAGAVVTKDIAPYTIVVGNPAKLLEK